MLLVLDAGNSSVSGALYDGAVIVRRFGEGTEVLRKLARSSHHELVDCLGRQEFIDDPNVDDVAICSVLPWLDDPLSEVLERRLGMPPMFVGPHLDCGLQIRYDPPESLGPDRLADAAGAYMKYGGPVIVVDAGTATNIEAVSGKGDYLGGAIAPGMNTGARALFERAARLKTVSLKPPEQFIGQSTEMALRSGCVLGHTALIDGLVEGMRWEMDAPQARVVATGGIANVLAQRCRTVDLVDPDLTFDGVRLIWERNR